MRIGLIRHGETEWNAKGLLQGASDIPLNSQGRRQAESAGRMLESAGWQHIYSSPLVRAMETATTIAQLAGLPAPMRENLVTERGFGELEGTSYWLPDGTRAPLDHPSVEPMEAVIARTVQAVREIAERHPAEDVLVVCHGTVIRHVLGEFMSRPAPSIGNATLSVLETTGDAAPNDFRVVLANGYPLPHHSVLSVTPDSEDV